ncbi:hypothetical protein GY12_00765 [Micrococcus luteus]|nr:hypothetical protein GY12_00765 [Micrococcus luteus]
MRRAILRSNTQLLQVFIHPWGIGSFDIVEADDLVLDIEIQLTTQESTQVFMDEVIHGIACSELTQVFP